ncbi:hypothetical protein GCM10020258_28300 [Sphingomonas yabuuchiae]
MPGTAFLRSERFFQSAECVEQTFADSEDARIEAIIYREALANAGQAVAIRLNARHIVQIDPIVIDPTVDSERRTAPVSAWIIRR